MTNAQRLRKAIADLVRSVPDVGRVHEYERFSKDLSAFRAHYMEGEKVLGWYVTRASWREIPYSTLYNRQNTRWIIQGYMGFEDVIASEILFNGLVDTIAAKIRRTPVLQDMKGGIANIDTTDGAGIQLEEFTPVMFAGVLCHSARLSLATAHLEEIVPDISDESACEKGVIHTVIDPVDVTAPPAEILTNYGEENA